MHAADLFEPWKRLVETDQAGCPRARRLLVSAESESIDHVRAMNVVRNGVERSGDARVLACFVPGEPDGWRDPTCTHISTGTAFMPFDPFLLALGFSGSWARPEKK